ncbi:uncharacterized protein [Onthophagus taurus]|uniref:uncharacterized protein n=1 Tax=Onthophagus taurus TaxID=166361 RepID=UPI0039BE824E
MSLVAYDNSDSDGEELEHEVRENGKVIIPEKGLFTSLPQPNVQNNTDEVTEEEDEFLKKKEVGMDKPPKQKIKITVPLPSDFSDEEDEGGNLKKKQKTLSKSSGLFAILPPPKTQPITTKHFVPNSVKRNLTPRNATQNVKNPKINKAPPTKPKKEIVPEELESDDEDLKDIPDTFDEETWQKVCGKVKKPIKPIIEVVSEPGNEAVIEIAPEPVKSYQGLDNKAFKELMGANHKRKGQQQNINIVDINEEEILPDKDVWMTKALTDPELSAKYVVKDPVNDTCKRKHHITYLAQQAKANEQELQNQWASNRFTRQKTQAKYGF